MDDDYENLEDLMQEAIEAETQIVHDNDHKDDEDDDNRMVDLSKKGEYVATVKGVSVQDIIESKILSAIGGDDGLLQRLKRKHNILYFNAAMLQEAYNVITGKQILSLKKYETREIQADFIRYYKLLKDS